MSLPAADLFAGTVLSANWTIDAGAFVVASGVVSSTGTGDQIAHWNADSFPNDQYSQITFLGSIPNNAKTGGVVVRCTNNNNFYGARMGIAGAVWTTELFCIHAGTFASFTTNTTSWAINDVMMLQVVGNVLTLYKNGVSVLSFTDTNAFRASGSAGILTSANGTSPGLGVWKAGQAGFVKKQQASINQPSLSFTPTNPTDLLIAIVATSVGLGNPVASISDSLGSAWQTAVSTFTDSAGSFYSAFYLPNCSASAATITTSFLGGTPSSVDLTILEYANIASVSPLIAASTGNHQSAPGVLADAITSGLINVPIQPALLVGYNHDGGTTASSAGTGFISRGTYAGTGVGSFEDKLVTATGNVAATFTTTVGTDSQVTFALAFAMAVPSAAALSGAAAAASAGTGALSTAIKMAAAASSVSSASAQILNQTNITLTAPLYTGVGGILDPNFWLDSLPHVGSTIWYDSSNIQILTNGEIVANSNNVTAVCQFLDDSGQWAFGLIVIVPTNVGYATVQSTMISSLTTAIKLAAAANTLVSASGALSTASNLQAAAQSVVSATAALNAQIKLAGAIVDQVTVTGKLNNTDLQGALVSTTQATGLLQSQIKLLGAAAAVAVASGALSTQIVLAANAVTVSSSIGVISTKTTLQGAAIAASVATGSLLTQSKLAGAAASLVSATGALSNHISLVAAAVSASSASGTLLTANALRATASSVNTASGQLTTLILLRGTAWVDTIARGDLKTGSVLAGVMSDTSSATAEFSAPGSGVGIYSEDPAWVLLSTQTPYTEEFPVMSPLASRILGIDFTADLNPGEFLEGIIVINVGCSAGSDPNLPSGILNGPPAYNVGQTHVDIPVHNAISGNDYYFSATAPVTSATAAKPYKILTRYGLLQVRG